MKKEFMYGQKTVEVTAYGDGIIRVHIGEPQCRESFFDRYHLYKEPDKNAGRDIENGIAVAGLSVTVEEGKIRFQTDRVERTVDFSCTDTETVKNYFNTELHNMRPEPKQILGEDAKRHYGTVDFQKRPKYFTVQGIENEAFYGGGSGNPDRLTLNDGIYLNRVVYPANEMPVPFLMTKAGYGILCNTTWWHGLDVCHRNKNEILWYLPDGDMDFMIFAGNTLADILERYTYLTGRPMLLPKWAHGLAFLDQYTADQYEVMRNAATFREKQYPCDSISLEPGWMEKRYDFSVNKKWSNGPRGKFLIEEWARSKEYGKINPCFFTAALARYGFKLHLWLCCQHDFTVEEERRIGNEIDPETPDWFDHLRYFMNDGAASFKCDPCHTVDNADEAHLYKNGCGDPEIHNLIQTLFMRDMARGAEEHTGKRAMHHYCGAYTGTGAYTATNTGDNGGGPKTLAWTLNCGMSGISNVTCDMDIFKKAGLHYCFFTTWCELNSWWGFRQPWWAGEDIEKIFAYYDKLRYRILPYIYSTAIKANMTGFPVCRAMPLVFEDENLQDNCTQYMFGENFLVGAFTEEITLPENNLWVDYWTGKTYRGGQTLHLDIPENRGGYLFVRGGAIIPTDIVRNHTVAGDTEHLILEIYPYMDSSYTFYEDDGESLAYRQGERAVTKFTCHVTENGVQLHIGKREGSFKGMGHRIYSVKLFLSKSPKKVMADGEKIPFVYEDGFCLFDMGGAQNAEIVLV